MKLIFSVLILVISMTIVSCKTENLGFKPTSSPFKPGPSLYVMGYNLHNLFDVQHDTDKNDIQFLPLNYPGKFELCEKHHRNSNGSLNHYYEFCINTDWTPTKLHHKINVIQKVVRHSGYTPDLLGVSEIENKNVAQMLAQSLGYKKFVISNSPDRRGIDVALYFNPEKLELLEVYEKAMEEPFYQGKATRNLLIVLFTLKGRPQQEVLAVSVNHWPSQGNPDPVRLQVADQVMKSLEMLEAKYIQEYDFSKFHSMMLGDFNVASDDRPHAFKDGIFADHWNIKFKDLQVERDLIRPVHDNPPGTYFYRKNKSWNRLDRIFVSPSLMSPSSQLQVNTSSFNIVAKDFMSRNFFLRNRQGQNIKSIKIPNGFRHDKNNLNEMGVSDHYPVEVYLEY